MAYTVRELGSIEKQAEKLLNECRKMDRIERRHGPGLELSHRETADLPLFDEAHDKMRSMIPSDVVAFIRSSSWYFSGNMISHVTRKWHVDGNGDYAMVICGYPKQPEILVVHSERTRELLNDCFEWTLCPSARARAVCQALRNEEAHIYPTKPGYLYYLGPGVIHRSPYFRPSVKRLVIRLWLTEYRIQS